MPNVLIADDEEFVRYYLKCLLEQMGYVVVGEVDNGKDLCASINDAKPDILLLDINMPNLKGNEFLEKHGKEYSNICIIVLTISVAFSVKKQLQNLGYPYFIRKDTPPEVICEYIKDSWNNFSKGNH